MFWTLHLIGWLSLHCVVLFRSFDLFFHLAPISLSWCTHYNVRGRASDIHQGKATHFVALWHCTWGGVQEGTMPLVWFLVSFQSFSLLPTNKMALLVLIPMYVWTCVCSRSLLVSPTNSPVRLGVSLTAAIPTEFSSQRFWGFTSPCWNLRLHGLSHSPVVSPSLAMLVCQSLPCLVSSLPPLPVSIPSPSLDECFFFNSLVVGLPQSSIFWQFWLFFVLKFVVFSFGCVRGQSASTYTSILARVLTWQSHLIYTSYHFILKYFNVFLQKIHVNLKIITIHTVWNMVLVLGVLQSVGWRVKKKKHALRLNNYAHMWL